MPQTLITEIGAGKVHLERCHKGVQSSLEEIGNVRLVTSKPPTEALYRALIGTVPELHLIGDARESH